MLHKQTQWEPHVHDTSCLLTWVLTSALTWKNFVWNLVKAQPIRRSSSCRASTLRASFSFGFTRLARAALISFSVIAEKRARNTTYKKKCNKYLGKRVTLQNFICKSTFSLCSFDLHKSAFTQFINLGMPSICTTPKKTTFTQSVTHPQNKTH